MSDRWDRLAEASDGDYSREDFEVALYRLITEQVLYASDRRSRAAYRVVDAYESDFSDQLALIGADLVMNRRLHYAAAVSRHTKLGTASVEETLVGVILREIQDEAMQRGEMTEEGEIFCDISTLADRYKLQTQRSFPEKGRLDLILRALKRYGIIRIVDEDEDAAPSPAGDVEQPYTLAIRPAISVILGDGALATLAQWRRDAQPVRAPASTTPTPDAA